jgi:hypothetical protein
MKYGNNPSYRELIVLYIFLEVIMLASFIQLKLDNLDIEDIT